VSGDKSIKVGVVGASGYTARELTRILLKHPYAKLEIVCSHSKSGERLEKVHRELHGMTDIILEEINAQELAHRADVVFLCLPAGAGQEIAKGVVQCGKKVIDLSADYRLDIETYKKWYGNHSAPEIIKKAVYGLPELWRKEIAHATVVANPGCYATAAIIALAPLVSKGMISSYGDKGSNIVVDGKSGASGAGRKVELEYLMSELWENMKPYKVLKHRHSPEIAYQLERFAEACRKNTKSVTDSGVCKFPVHFAPHLMPIARGLLTTCYAGLSKKRTTVELLGLYRRFYDGAPFVRVLGDEEQPETGAVLGTNFCDIGVTCNQDGTFVVVTSAIDNLVKGASGQAVQNMNIMFGIDEKAGL
jgi:N-acetyl-gamma-glutamyl-phosphate reductase